MKESRLDLDDLKAELKARAEEVACYYLGEPSQRTSRELRWGSRGRRWLSLRSGAYWDHEAVQGGSLLDLIKDALSCSFPKAIEEARAWLGDAPTAPRSRYTASDHDADLQQRIVQAQDIIAAGRPIPGTLAETYLAGRCIEDLPGALYVTCQTIKRVTGWRWWRWPAVAFPVTTTNGNVRAVQLVALDRDGNAARHWDHDGKLKVSRGLLKSAAMRLPGADGDPLILAEGAETAASCWQATGWETWAKLGSIAGVDLTSVPTDRLIVIAADDDPARSPARKALLDAMKRWKKREGRRIVLAKPHRLSRGLKDDFNDIHQTHGIEAVRERLEAALPRISEAKGEPVKDARNQLFRTVENTVSELLTWQGNENHPALSTAVKKCTSAAA